MNPIKGHAKVRPRVGVWNVRKKKKKRVKKKKRGFCVCKRRERERRESLVVGLGWGEVQKIRFLGFLCEGSQSVYFFFGLCLKRGNRLGAEGFDPPIFFRLFGVHSMNTPLFVEFPCFHCCH